MKCTIELRNAEIVIIGQVGHKFSPYKNILLQIAKRSISAGSGSGGGAGGGTKFPLRWASPKLVLCHLFLFHKTLMLCRTNDNLSEPNNPHLIYEAHIR